MLAINETLQGRYRIIRQLGQGGMGAIYVAEDGKRFGKLVALKEILIDLAKIPDSKQRENVRRAFEREAKILTQLEHDAFPQVIDYFLETDRQFLVMELVQGEDLGGLLEKNQNPFPLKEVLHWTSQLLDALDYLHTLTPPIIHRDIKPQNLKLTQRGKIKLLDFGIATGSDAHVHNTITSHTFLAATLNYSPLEQIIKVIDPNYREFLEQKFGDRLTRIITDKTTPAADIYALGATLYHLLTTRLPVDAPKRMLEIWADKPDPMPNPREANADIPPEISDWLLKSMAIEREDRFASAIEMQKALDEIISGGKQREDEEKRRKWLEEHENSSRERDAAEQKIETMETARLVSHEQAESTGVSGTDIEPQEIAETRASLTMPSLTVPSSEVKTVEEEIGSEREAETLFNEQRVTSETASEGAPFVPAAFFDKPKETLPRILPIAAIILLIPVIGVAVFFMMSYSAGTNVNQPVNSVVVIPTHAPANSPTPGQIITEATPATTLPANIATKKPSDTLISGRPTPQPQTSRPQTTKTAKPKPKSTVKLDDIIND